MTHDNLTALVQDNMVRLLLAYYSIAQPATSSSASSRSGRAISPPPRSWSSPPSTSRKEKGVTASYLDALFQYMHNANTLAVVQNPI